jgi:hypothetical protein
MKVARYSATTSAKLFPDDGSNSDCVSEPLPFAEGSYGSPY